MREATARARPCASRARSGRLRATVMLLAAALLVGGCSSGGPESSADPGESAATSASESATVSPSPTTSPEPEKPKEPGFAPGRKGKRAFVEHIVEGWGYGLATNDPSVLLDASGPKPCRGCDTYRAELKQRADEGWYVKFPGARVRKVTFTSDGDVEVGRAVVDVPASESFFDDGTFRNDNKAHKGATFLIDLRADGEGKREHWTLLAFSIK